MDGHEPTGSYFWKMLVVAPQQKVEGQGTQKHAATDTTENQEIGNFFKYKPFISWKTHFFLPAAHLKSVFSGELLFRELKRWVPWEKHYFRTRDKRRVRELQLCLQCQPLTLYSCILGHMRDLPVSTIHSSSATIKPSQQPEPGHPVCLFCADLLSLSLLLPHRTSTWSLLYHEVAKGRQQPELVPPLPS